MSTILWKRLDRPGHECCRLDAEGDGWVLEGSAVLAHESDPCALAYRIECDSTWRTRSTAVHGWIGAERVDVDIVVHGEERWLLDGRHVAAVDGAVDVDLNFSPSTNLLPIRRCPLEIGAFVTVRAAWLRFPSMTLEPLEQVYRRTGVDTYRYESAGGAFVADLDVAADGMVVRYPGFAERIG